MNLGNLVQDGKYKYKTDVRRCEEIGHLIEKAMSGLPECGEVELVLRFAQLTGLAQSTVCVMISNYIHGHNVVDISSEAHGSKKLHLNRLALFYTLLGLEESNSIIGLTRVVNPAFEYPMGTNTNKDPSAPQATVTVNFSGPNHTLTRPQLCHLEYLARVYAQVNRAIK